MFLAKVIGDLDQSAVDLRENNFTPWQISAMTLTVTMMSQADVLVQTLDLTREQRQEVAARLAANVQLVHDRLVEPTLD